MAGFVLNPILLLDSLNKNNKKLELFIFTVKTKME